MAQKTASLARYYGYVATSLGVLVIVTWRLAKWVPMLPWIVLVGVLGLSALYIGTLALALSLMELLNLGARLGVKGMMALRLQVLGLFTVLEALVRRPQARLSLQRALIALNNRLLDACNFKVPYDRMLVLTPHCVQRAKCGIKVTGTDNHNLCTECGACNVGSLKAIQRTYGVRVAIATGGTLARKIITENKPKLVIAVACERDLVSGLKDAAKLPVYALQNERPNGPCVDTRFDVAHLERLIKEKGE